MQRQRQVELVDFVTGLRGEDRMGCNAISLWIAILMQDSNRGRRLTASPAGSGRATSAVSSHYSKVVHTTYCTSSWRVQYCTVVRAGLQLSEALVEGTTVHP